MVKFVDPIPVLESRDVPGLLRTTPSKFKELIKRTNEITYALRKRVVNGVTTIKWSLSIWVYEANTSATELLNFLNSSRFE